MRFRSLVASLIFLFLVAVPLATSAESGAEKLGPRIRSEGSLVAKARPRLVRIAALARRQQFHSIDGDQRTGNVAGRYF